MRLRSLPLLLAVLPLAAQVLPDGPAFGGSKVFSLGIDPRGNSARFDQAAPGWYLGRVSGDLKAKDHPAALDGLAGLASADAAGQALALGRLAENPWAERATGYLLGYAKAGGIHGSLGRETLTGALATVDADPAHRGAGLGQNGTTLELRRATVNRLVTGAGSMADGAAYGVALRLEDWRFGHEVRAQNPATGQVALGDPRAALDFDRTSGKRFAASLDAGVVFELAPGLRAGATVDRLVPVTLGDLKEQPQLRAGVQIDLGSMAQLSAEADVNEATRMPFAAKQKGAAVSLRIVAGPVVQLLVGAERRTLAGASTTAVGATLYARLGTLHLGAGMRFGQDRPRLALGAKVE